MALLVFIYIYLWPNEVFANGSLGVEHVSKDIGLLGKKKNKE